MDQPTGASESSAEQSERESRVVQSREREREMAVRTRTRIY
jgi:hypothetical protein